MGGVEESFFVFGGLTERVQVDNAKVFVLNASNEQFRWNPKFLQFCGFFAIEPCRSAPLSPLEQREGRSGGGDVNRVPRHLPAPPARTNVEHEGRIDSSLTPRY